MTAAVTLLATASLATAQAPAKSDSAAVKPTTHDSAMAAASKHGKAPAKAAAKPVVDSSETGMAGAKSVPTDTTKPKTVADSTKPK